MIIMIEIKSRPTLNSVKWRGKRISWKVLPSIEGGLQVIDKAGLTPAALKKVLTTFKSINKLKTA